MRQRTVIVVAHRLSTVKDADLIAVVGHGRVLDQGTHLELLQKSVAYANLVRKQLTGSAGSAEGIAGTVATEERGQDSA
jgi:ABC-type multidrug transport system fused ATPase/permease subunit